MSIDPSTPPAVVELHDVGKVFGTAPAEVTALDGIDLTIREGEFVSLIGPSGCGKSTLLRPMVLQHFIWISCGH